MKSYLLLCLLTLPVTGLADDTSQTYHGQPADSTLSADDATGYVDQVVKDWLASQSSSNSPKIGPRDLSKLAAQIKALGMSNLIAAFGKTTPDTAYRMNVPINPQEEIKRSIIEKALSITAGTTDIDALLGLYDTRPLVLSVLMDHPEWDSDPRVTDFISAHLDQLPDAYKQSDIAPTTLLLLAARNPSSSIQTKLDATVADAVGNDGHYPDSHLYINLLTVLSEIPNATIEKHVPDIFTVLAARAKSPLTDVYNDVSPENVFTQLQLANMAINKPTFFADQKTKDAILKLSAAAQDSGFKGARVLIPAAVCGSNTDLIKLAHDAGGSNLSPMDKNLATKYLASINVPPGLDSTNKIISSGTTAGYDPVKCTWTFQN